MEILRFEVICRPAQGFVPEDEPESTSSTKNSECRNKNSPFECVFRQPVSHFAPPHHEYGPNHHFLWCATRLIIRLQKDTK